MPVLCIDGGSATRRRACPPSRTADPVVHGRLDGGARQVQRADAGVRSGHLGVDGPIRLVAPHPTKLVRGLWSATNRATLVASFPHRPPIPLKRRAPFAAGRSRPAAASTRPHRLSNSLSVPSCSARSLATQFPSVPAWMPRSRAIWAIGLPVSRTMRTAPSRNSGSYFLRVSGMTNPYSSCLHVFGGCPLARFAGYALIERRQGDHDDGHDDI